MTISKRLELAKIKSNLYAMGARNGNLAEVVTLTTLISRTSDEFAIEFASEVGIKLELNSDWDRSEFELYFNEQINHYMIALRFYSEGKSEGSEIHFVPSIYAGRIELVASFQFGGGIHGVSEHESITLEFDGVEKTVDFMLNVGDTFTYNGTVEQFAKGIKKMVVDNVDGRYIQKDEGQEFTFTLTDFNGTQTRV